MEPLEPHFYSEVVAIHAILGFDARDLVAGLVEALEEIRKPAVIIGFGKKATGKMRAEQMDADHKRVRGIAQAALEAYKKGEPTT